MNRPQMVHQALWAMRPFSAAEMGRGPRLAYFPLSSQSARRKDCARKNWPYNECIPWPADEGWPSALGRHSE